MPEAAPVIITGLPAMILRFLAIGTPYLSGADVVVEGPGHAAASDRAA